MQPRPDRPGRSSGKLVFFDLPADEYESLREGMRDEDKWNFTSNAIEQHMAFLVDWVPGFQKWAERLEWPKGSTHLDVGAGPGQLSYLVARQGYHSIAVELDATNLAGGLALQESIRPTAESSMQLWVANIFDLPLPENSVDFITIKEALHHLPDAGRLLGELARVLKPDGAIYVWEPYWPSHWLGPLRWPLVDGWLRWMERSKGIRHVYYSLGDYRRMFKRSKLQFQLRVNHKRLRPRHYLTQHRLLFGSIEAVLTRPKPAASVPRPSNRRPIQPEDFVVADFLDISRRNGAAYKAYLDSLS